MKDIQKEIIAYIKRNRVSTTEVADCLGKTGAVANVHAVNRGHFCVGAVRYIFGHTESNWPIHDQARFVQEDEVVLMDGIDVKGRALVGELVSKFIADNFNNFKDEAKLSFYIHPDIISYAQQKIAALANSYDFEGKIALHKDASLAKSDCRIEWENGGVELKGADQLAKVADLLDAQKM